MANIITVVPARWSVSDCLEATVSVESMAENAEEREGANVGIFKRAAMAYGSVAVIVIGDRIGQ